MRWLSVLALAVVGLALPAALALGVYLASASTLADPLEVAPLTVQTIAEPSEAAKRKAKRPKPTPPGTTVEDDDRSTTVEDGKDRGGDRGEEQDGDSGNSGSGSDNSGSGSSGSGSGNSGSGSANSGSGGDD